MQYSLWASLTQTVSYVTEWQDAGAVQLFGGCWWTTTTTIQAVSNAPHETVPLSAHYNVPQLEPCFFFQFVCWRWANIQVLWLRPTSNFNLLGQILRTGGVALNHCSLLILMLLSCSSLFMQMLCTQETKKPYRDTNSKKREEEEEDA
jgi:hypothetical protein